MAEGVGAVPGAKSDMKVTGALANDAKTYIDAGKTNGWIHTILFCKIQILGIFVYNISPVTGG